MAGTHAPRHPSPHVNNGQKPARTEGSPNKDHTFQGSPSPQHLSVRRLAVALPAVSARALSPEGHSRHAAPAHTTHHALHLLHHLLHLFELLHETIDLGDWPSASLRDSCAA